MFWGTRGSLAAPGPETVHYGGNTVCVEVRGADDHVGHPRRGHRHPPARRRARSGDASRRPPALAPAHGPHRRPRVLRTVAPARPRGAHLGAGVDDARSRRAARPLPVAAVVPGACARARMPPDAPRRAARRLRVPGFLVRSRAGRHPGPTVGYRLEHADGVVTYLSDHEPALGVGRFPDRAEWTSGFDLAYRADLLIHDAQYDGAEYRDSARLGSQCDRRCRGVRHARRGAPPRRLPP